MPGAHGSLGHDNALLGTILAAWILIPLAMLPALVAALRRAADPLWLAHQIERQFPELDARLLCALEQKPDASAQLGYLQQTVIDQTVTHAKNNWQAIVPSSRLRLSAVVHFATLTLCIAVVVLILRDMRGPHASARPIPCHATPPSKDFTVKIDPEDTSVERNSSFFVRATFGTTRLPADVELLLKDSDGKTQQLPMTKSLDDPLFAGGISNVKNALQYAVRFGSEQTRWYKVDVFDYPALEKADATLDFPKYTGLEEKHVEDTRSITAVEGTQTTLSFHLNKPVAEAKLMPALIAEKTPTTSPAAMGPAPTPVPATAPAAIALTVDPKDPTLYTATMDLKHSEVLHLALRDADQRTNRDQAQLTINVTVNKPPDLKMVTPGRDVNASPIEELAVKATVWDDFGVTRAGITYSLAGQPPTDVIIAQNIPGNDRQEVAHVISLEKLKAEPDQLLSYNLWVEDIGPDGKPRRTMGDMFFAEIRPFEEIYHQGEQPTAEELAQQQQRQQQQQQNGQGGQNAQQADARAETEKQLIAATWKVIRRETTEPVSSTFADDVKLISDAQGQTREQTTQMSDRITDDRSAGFLKSALDHMTKAAGTLDSAAAASSAKPLTDALASEQAAYSDLLKLRAHEFDVVRGNQRQQGQQGQNSAQAQRQQQLDQLDLQNQENRYQTQRAAQQQPQPQQPNDPAQQANRQVLSRLRELSQRQEDLNQQMRELQSALAQAREQAQKDELQRQLARLRDQQQQMLRDTDELRDVVNQPQNQERMADAAQQLDQTRDNVRNAADQLQQGQVAQAQAAGQRAAEQLNNLQQQVRQQAAGQFNDAMQQMRAGCPQAR